MTAALYHKEEEHIFPLIKGGRGRGTEYNRQHDEQFHLEIMQVVLDCFQSPKIDETLKRQNKTTRRPSSGGNEGRGQYYLRLQLGLFLPPHGRMSTDK